MITGQIILGNVNVGTFTAAEDSLVVEMVTQVRQAQVDKLLLEEWPIPVEVAQPDEYTKVDGTENVRPTNISTLAALYVALESLGLDVINIQEFDVSRDAQL